MFMLVAFAAGTALDVEFAYRVTYEGKTVGFIDSADKLSQVNGEVLSGIKAYAAESYIGETDVKLSLTLGSKVSSVSDVAENILNNEDSLKKASVLTVDGKPLFAVENGEQALSEALDSRLNVFKKGGEDEVSFLSDIKVVNGYVPCEQLAEQSAANEYISCADVKTVKTESYVDEIPFKTVKTESKDYLKGYVKVTSKGVKGQADVTAVVTCVNGVETERNVIESTTITEPVSQKELVGTATISKVNNTQYASGNAKFMWPLPTGVYQKITSYMGDGRGHKGLDIACRKGTNIMAAMGGTVQYAHYRHDYGNFVVINHGNGYKTVYAHASKLLVSKGQTVEKGQVIALVGTTGQSTGNHLHFEVRINGTAVNPLRYTSK